MGPSVNRERKVTLDSGQRRPCAPSLPVWFGALRSTTESLCPQALGVIMFGSVARGDAGPESDVDVLVVRPASIPFADDCWTDAVIDWSVRAQQICGRPVEVLEASSDEMPSLLGRPGSSVSRDIVREGVVVSGTPLSGLIDV